MRAPPRSAALSITQPNMCAKGTIPATTSSGPKRRSGDAAYWRSVATAPACVWMAVLGRPLVPLVLSSSAIASGSPPFGGIGSAAGSAPSASSASVPAAAAASRTLGIAAASATT